MNISNNPVSTSKPVEAPKVSTTPTSHAAPASPAAVESAAQAPVTQVSVSKVAQMKAAIEQGQFKIDYEVLADKLLQSRDLGKISIDESK